MGCVAADGAVLDGMRPLGKERLGRCKPQGIEDVIDLGDAHWRDGRLHYAVCEKRAGYQRHEGDRRQPGGEWRRYWMHAA